MSMAKHTPGPWLQDTRGYPHPDVKAACGRKVATTWGLWSNTPKSADALQARTEVARANARLIAAAPDLLAALKAVTQHAIYDPEGSLTREEFDALMAQADAAVAKAEGGAS